VGNNGTGPDRRWELRVETTEVGGAVLTIARGRIGHASAAVLADALAGAGAGHPWVVLDVEAVDYVSSAGLRLLDEAAARCAAARGALILAGVSDPVLIALDLAGITTRLVLEPTRESALARVGR